MKQSKRSNDRGPAGTTPSSRSAERTGANSGTTAAEGKNPPHPNTKTRWEALQIYLRNEWELYLIFLVPLAYIVIFKYIPIYGAQIAFRDFSPAFGIWQSPWVGLKHFERFFSSVHFWRILRNTFWISAYGLLAGFPFPIILALALNYAGNGPFKKSVQLLTYMPHFISTVVMVGILHRLLHPRIGAVNVFISVIGGQTIDFLGSADLFASVYVWSGVWQSAGYSAVVYLASLSAVDPQLHESAIVDGASILRRIWYIDLPTILPTIVIILIFSVSRLLNVGFEKIYLMQNNLNLRASEVISTYVYKVGLIQANYSFGAAVGFFNAIVAFTLLTSTNAVARRVGQTSLW